MVRFLRVELPATITCGTCSVCPSMSMNGRVTDGPGVPECGHAPLIVSMVWDAVHTMAMTAASTLTMDRYTASLVWLEAYRRRGNAMAAPYLQAQQQR